MAPVSSILEYDLRTPMVTPAFPHWEDSLPNASKVFFVIILFCGQGGCCLNLEVNLSWANRAVQEFRLSPT